MGKKTLVTVVCTALILFAGSTFANQQGRSRGQFQPTSTPTPTPTPTGLEQFGVCAQYYRSDEMATYYPDLWTLVKYVGASYVSGAVNRSAADQAAEHGVKLIMQYTSPYADPDNPGVFETKEKVKAHFDIYNIAQYRNHPGVYGHVVHGEPCMAYNFDPRYPSAKLLQLIDNMKYACDYVRSLDPTHPVWVALDPAGAFSYSDAYWVEKRKAWINLFIDFCDVLEYHLYLHGDAGREWWRNPELMRTQLVTMLDQVLIPCSRGKPIIIGETGCPSGDYKDWKGEIAEYSAKQQAEYFRIFGEETRERGILVFVFKLIDAATYEEQYASWGLFKRQNDGKMNIPKIAATNVKDYLSIPLPTHALKVDATPISVSFTINGILKTTPYSESLEEGEYTIIISPKVQAAYTYVFVQWEDKSTNSTRIIKLTSNMSLLATYRDLPQVDETSLYTIILGVFAAATIVVTGLWALRRHTHIKSSLHNNVKKVKRSLERKSPFQTIVRKVSHFL